MIRTKKRRSIRLFGKDMVPERRRSAIKKNQSSTASPPYPLPSALLQTVELMGGPHVDFVTRKILERSDIDVSQNRFFIPKNDVLWGLLSEEERGAVEGGGGVDVGVVDMKGVRYDMKMKKWASLKQIVLNCGWRKLVEDNKLMAEVDCVELWSFRAESKLCFGLNIRSENTINH